MFDDEPEDYCGATETEVIESLREDLESAEEQLRDQMARWGAVVDERDRLRAALEKIVSYSMLDDTPAAKWTRDTARAALSGEHSAEQRDGGSC